MPVGSFGLTKKFVGSFEIPKGYVGSFLVWESTRRLKLSTALVKVYGQEFMHQAGYVFPTAQIEIAASNLNMFLKMEFDAASIAVAAQHFSMATSIGTLMFDTAEIEVAGINFEMQVPREYKFDPHAQIEIAAQTFAFGYGYRIGTANVHTSGINFNMSVVDPGDPNFEPHRYWRIEWTVNAVSTENQSVCPAIELYETEFGRNVVGGGTASSDSGSNATGSFHTNYRINGGTYWVSATTAPPHWLQYDFGAGNAKAINAVGILSSYSGGEDKAPGTLKVWYSDNGNDWTLKWTTDNLYWGQRTFQRIRNPNLPIPSYTGEPFGAYKIWRFLTCEGVGNQPGSFAELEVRATRGGADQCTGGTASALDIHSAPYAAANAFDDNVATLWHGANNARFSWVEYTFGSPVVLQEAVATARNDSDNAKPFTFLAQYLTDDADRPSTAFGMPNTQYWEDGQVKTYRNPYQKIPTPSGGSIWEYADSGSCYVAPLALASSVSNWYVIQNVSMGTPGINRCLLVSISVQRSSVSGNHNLDFAYLYTQEGRRYWGHRVVASTNTNTTHLTIQWVFMIPRTEHCTAATFVMWKTGGTTAPGWWTDWFVHQANAESGYPTTVGNASQHASTSAATITLSQTGEYLAIYGHSHAAAKPDFTVAPNLSNKQETIRQVGVAYRYGRVGHGSNAPITLTMDSYPGSSQGMCGSVWNARTNRSEDFAFTGWNFHNSSSTITGVPTGASNGNKDFIIMLAGQYGARPDDGGMTFAGKRGYLIGRGGLFNSFDFVAAYFVPDVPTGSNQTFTISGTSTVYRNSVSAYRVDGFNWGSATFASGNSVDPSLSGYANDVILAIGTVDGGGGGPGITLDTAVTDFGPTNIEDTFRVIGGHTTGLAAGSKQVVMDQNGGTRDVLGICRISKN